MQQAEMTATQEDPKIFAVELTAAELVELFAGRLLGRFQETRCAIGDDVDAYLDNDPKLRYIPDNPWRIYIRLAVACPDALTAVGMVRGILRAQGVEDEVAAQSPVPTDYWYD